MRWLVVLAVAIAGCSAGVLKDPTKGFSYNDRYFYFPGDGDGSLHLVDTLEPVNEAFLDKLTRNPDNNGYWLYTRANPTTPQILRPEDLSSIVNSNFDSKKETVFLAHGWLNSGESPCNRALTEAFLEAGDVNVIVLDWQEAANEDYLTSKQAVAEVGKGLGRFVNWITSLGVSYDNIHLVGFSLGGHLVGNAGRETGGRVRRITALDPAGPLWLLDSNRIVSTDGQYVEVIHTNTLFYGFTQPCGDADFYPNGGASMPGCELDNGCSHDRAYKYMAASVKYNHFLANECNSWGQALLNRCTGDVNPMGNNDLTKTRTGIFRVDTGSEYPF